MLETSSEFSKESKTIFIVEDNEFFLQGLKFFIDQHKEFHVVGYAKESSTALEKIKDYQPDICIVDVVLPDEDGLSLIKKIKGSGVHTQTLVLSESHQDDLVERIVKSGADSFVTKSEPNHEIYNSLVALASNTSYFSPKAGHKFYQSLKKEHDHKPPNREPHITPRELQVARLLAKKMSNKEIAQEMNCSAFTVKCHKANLMRKLHVNRSAAIVAWLESRKAPVSRKKKASSSS